MVGLAVPVMKNFKGLTQLMASVDIPVRPYVINNWDYNHGVSKAWNVALKWAVDEDYLVISNDDVVFHTGTLDTLVDCLIEHEADLVSVVASDTGQTGFHEADFPDFACYVVRPKSFVERFGYFDENFSPAYFEDNDMAYRIKVSGGRQGLCLDARVNHAGSATQYMDEPVVTSEMFEANRAYYKAKWGGEPHQEAYTRPHNQEHLSIKEW